VDLNAAIQKHAEWKFKFRNAILSGEPLDAAAIAKDNNCEMGKWLHGEAKALYGKATSHAKCIVSHAAFHVEAGKVAVVINAKRKEEAEKMLSAGSAFSEASKRVGVAIIELKNEIGG
jgi:methyl-accepting chemotaxis protein